ncbi:hypothetical protein [Undibacterium pigrum]|uniref:Uncharacterized protein n=1 Tax=Undibacterium pigrum TaxID=401470 RepID=A0A318IM10_9BURK|nr:hypothetical protein [Undibacterium pigrum]PXX33474.1 hypothetical protein DFR42_1333 [Undibacterium pigrum]
MNSILKKVASILFLILLALLPLPAFTYFLFHEPGEQVREIYSYEDQKKEVAIMSPSQLMAHTSMDIRMKKIATY